MTALLPARAGWSGLVLPGVILLGLAGLLAVQIGLVIPLPTWQPKATVAPATVTVPTRTFSYRATGDYQQSGRPVDAPLLTRRHDALEIMTYQVSAADYARCVVAGTCAPAEPRQKASGNVSVTGISFSDAERYAAWLSQQTGATWRLPSTEEWAFAAGSKASDPALGVDDKDPARRWLASYEKETALASTGSVAPQPPGSHGVNEFGLADLAGNVWEWTSTCHGRTWLDANGREIENLQTCGVRLLEGRHRTAMSFFVRDALAGGCTAGAPPDNLGFRLVREQGWIERLLALLAG